MIYIKYISKKYPSFWSIWQHQQGDIIQYLVIASHKYCDNSPIPIDLIEYKKHNHIEYLTEEEVDLIKLELL